MVQGRSTDRLVRLIRSTNECNLGSLIPSHKAQIPFPLCCVIRAVFLDTKRLPKQDQHEFVSLWLSPSPCDLSKFYESKSDMFSYPFYVKFVVNKNKASECDWHVLFETVEPSVNLLSVKFP